VDNQIFGILAESQKANQIALDLFGRQFGLQFAIVTNCEDPLKLRRIKATTESKGGLTETDWLMPIKVLPYYDPPIPPVGSSIIIGFLDGNPHDGVYLGSTINRTNPQDSDQGDPVKDNSQVIPGDSRETIGGFLELLIKGYLKETVEKYAELLVKEYVKATVEDYVELKVKSYVEATVDGYLEHTVKETETRRTDQNLTVTSGETVLLSNDAGASLTLTAAGAVILRDSFGNAMILGGSSAGVPGSTSDFMWNTTSGNCNWSLGGNSLNITSASNVTIAGKSVTTLGANSTDGSILIGKGWP
jgi:hypothetical protein